MTTDDDAAPEPTIVGPVILLTGPTASGKSSLALRLATEFPMAILNADSIQVYREMSIGSAKPTRAEQGRVPHYLLDLVAPSQPFSAARYREVALAAMVAVHEQGWIPILVGGTGLYLRVVARGIVATPPVPPVIGIALEAEALAQGWPELHGQLARGDPELAARITPNDRQRIKRGLAVYRATGVPLTIWQRRQPLVAPFPLLKLALIPPRETLYPRIERRFDAMMADGLLAEVAALLDRGYDPDLPALKAVGYRQLIAHLQGRLSLAEAVALAKQESRRYAKRQLTWLRAEADLVLLPPDDPYPRACQVIADFLRQYGGRS